MSLAAIALGLVVGLSLGALGGGGSILTVPVLVYVLHENPHAATTASLVIVGTTALAGAAAHARAGRVRWRSGAIFGVLGAGGSIVGSRLSSRIDGHVLLASFAGLLLVVAAMLIWRMRQARRAGAPGPARTGTRSPLRVVAAATLVGLLTGFFGVGGGFIVVPALVLALNMAMAEAVGTSLLVIAINAAVALAARIGAHVALDWWTTGLFIAGAVAGSLSGTRLAGLARPERLGAAFSGLLVLVAGYTALRSTGVLA